MRRDRTAPDVALYRMGSDATLDPVRRWAARLLSSYERAPLRLFLMSNVEAVVIIEAVVTFGVRWMILRTARRDASRYPRGAAVPLSGWAGSALFIAVWTAVLSLVVRFWP